MSENQELAPPQKSRKKLWLIVGIVVVVLVVIVALVLVLGGSSTNKATSLKDSPGSSFKTVTDREYALMAKDPQAHVGECVQVFGRVTQADDKTGANIVRANTAATKKAHTYEYDINSLLSAKEGILSDYVANDQFSANVCVLGQFKYKNMLDAETSAIELQVFEISRLDAAN